MSGRPDGVVDVPDPVDYIVAQDTERGPKDRKSVATTLHHVHLPKSAEAGLIEYDPRSGTIRYNRHLSHEECLARVTNQDDIGALIVIGSASRGGGWISASVPFVLR